jgi:O-glycosyl hydrolase
LTGLDSAAVRRRTAFSTLALALVVALIGPAFETAGSAAKTASVDIRIDLKARHQVMQGFGSSERVWSDPHLSNNPTTVVPLAAQNAILRDLYTRLGLTRVRPVLDQGVQKTRNGPFAFGGKLADAHIAFVQQARRFGLRTFFPGPVYVEPWMKESDVDAYVNWAMAMLLHWRQAGLPPPLYAPLNEPQVNQNFSPDWMRRVTIALGERMRVAGLKTQLVIPDDVDPTNSYRRAAAVLADARARQYVGAVAFHIYGQVSQADIERLAALAARYDLPLWMTEFNDNAYANWPATLDWAAKMQGLIASGVSAVDYIWAFFGSWRSGESLISIEFDKGVYRRHILTPLYYIEGQFSRFIRPGYRRVGAPRSVGPIQTTAYVRGRRMVIVIVNGSGSPQGVRFAFSGGVVRGPLAGVRTTSSDTWRKLPSVRPVRGRVTTVLPPQSITTLTGAFRPR